ncbi:MAG: hypothetical protein ABF778_08395 [Liquorilactobacillus hordei]|uniref:hypothetical protein n=1 Tax=Liquorilactobacillus hordei TaxID=468911 RepID=UPI0039E8D2BA
MRKSISKCSIITITAFFVGILLPIAYTAHLGLTTKEDTTVEASGWGTWAYAREWVYASKVKKIGKNRYYVYYSRQGVQNMYRMDLSALSLIASEPVALQYIIGSYNHPKHGFRATEYPLHSGVWMMNNYVRWD